MTQKSCKVILFNYRSFKMFSKFFYFIVIFVLIFINTTILPINISHRSYIISIFTIKIIPPDIINPINKMNFVILIDTFYYKVVLKIMIKLYIVFVFIWMNFFMNVIIIK